MRNRIITISREFGSGGRSIGKMTAEQLGIPCYDSELLQKIAEKSGFDEQYIADAGEQSPGGFFGSAFSNRHLDLRMRIIFGRYNIGLLQSWRKRILCNCGKVCRLHFKG